MWQSQTGQDVCFHLRNSESELMKPSTALFPNTFVSPTARGLRMGKCKLLSGHSSSTWVCSPCGPAPASVHRRQEPICREPRVSCEQCCKYLTHSMECREQGPGLPEDAERDEDFLLTFQLVEDLLRKLECSDTLFSYNRACLREVIYCLLRKSFSFCSFLSPPPLFF